MLSEEEQEYLQNDDNIILSQGQGEEDSLGQDDSPLIYSQSRNPTSTNYAMDHIPN